MKEALKVGVSGVRGVVGDSFTPQTALSFAQAFATFVGHGPVVVGRDTRPTGAMIEQAVVAGLQSAGCQPILAGVVPTPTVLILTQSLRARGGIAITASHNPSQWNALKFAERTGMFLNELRAEELFDVYHQQNFPMVSEAEIMPVVVESDAMEYHIRRVVNYVDQKAIRKRKLKVAVDCCNGVGAVHSVSFLREVLGCTVFPVLDQPTGRFERDPEPLPENLKLLCDTVRANGCDIGFAQDPDGDRLAIVNEKGEPIGEDQTLALAVQQVLDAHEKGPVAINLATSKSVEFVARQRGVEVVKTRIGEINVSETMVRIGSVVGGEGNGGIIIPRMHPCRDSYIGMAVVLELMAMTGKTVSELRGAIPSYFMVKDKIRIRGEQAPEILRSLRRQYADKNPSLLDGIYIDFGDSWVHARRSNTEPVIRITAEAASPEEAARLAGEFRQKIEQAV
ncbi:MAG TPA: phosphoglucosamine mutase [Verrucomicrobia bacterium]|nr:MAG: phosphoglucosamine mutase [Lentisphaerae bacterium GWF2_57_35]HBA83835.1 phosphoglucosamine mutase [Verrucomicrobiota bacterium]